MISLDESDALYFSHFCATRMFSPLLLRQEAHQMKALWYLDYYLQYTSYFIILHKISIILFLGSIKFVAAVQLLICYKQSGCSWTIRSHAAKSISTSPSQRWKMCLSEHLELGTCCLLETKSIRILVLTNQMRNNMVWVKDFSRQCRRLFNLRNLTESRLLDSTKLCRQIHPYRSNKYNLVQPPNNFGTEITQQFWACPGGLQCCW